jgi:protein-disulfide isomerase
LKKQHLVIVGAMGLLLVFALASYLYTSQQAAESEAVAMQAESPLYRSYAQTSGPADAKVVLVEFFDPACETCRVFSGHVKTLLAAHPDKVRLVLRYAPFHQGADTMVKILEAARKQNKYWETLDVMYETQPYWASHHQPQPEKIWEFLPSAGVDIEKLRVDMNAPRYQEIIDQDLADAAALGVRKTPSFFVNGRPLASFGFRQLKAMLDAEVAAQYGP